jgi:hypothetical protein
VAERPGSDPAHSQYDALIAVDADLLLSTRAKGLFFTRHRRSRPVAFRCAVSQPGWKYRIEEAKKMFTRSPIFLRFQRYGQQVTDRNSGGIWWLLMAPGLVLTAVALAILVWPELLAYMVASVMLCTGIALIGWGWAMRRLERGMHERMTTLDRNAW